MMEPNKSISNELAASKNNAGMTFILLKKFAKTITHFMFTIKSGFLKFVHKPAFIIPPYIHMRRTGGKTVRHYYESGLKTYMPSVTAALQEGIQLDRPIRILDFGCGVARQLIHFTRDYPAPEYFACDVNADVIEFIKKNYPTVKAACNDFYPPLAYPDVFFDMVYSV